MLSKHILKSNDDKNTQCKILLRSSVYLILWMSVVLVETSAEDSPPTAFIQQPLPGSVETQGNQKTLLCSASGYPSPVYRWKKNAQFLTANNVTETALRLSNIQRSDGAVYQCLASNSLGALLSNRVKVLVAYLSPFPIVTNQDKTVSQGQAIIIDLPPIDSYPAPNVVWYTSFDEVPRETQRTHITLSNQLIILCAETSDDGTSYFASATNSFTTSLTSMSPTYSVRVLSDEGTYGDIPAQIIWKPLPVNVVMDEDMSATFECVANARPLNMLSLNWYRYMPSGERIKLKGGGAKYSLSLYNRRLIIINPKGEDAGIYECEASFGIGGAGSVVRTTANLSVLVKPSLLEVPDKKVTAPVDFNVTLPCLAAGIPKPSIQWYKNGEPIPTYEITKRFLLFSNGSLLIIGSKSSDSGVYQCFASSDAGEINTAVWVQVLSFSPLITLPPNNMTVIMDSNVTFSCYATGAPRPQIAWHRVTTGARREILLGSSNKFMQNGTTLTLLKVDTSDSGQYVCNASNFVGWKHASGSLTVLVQTRLLRPPLDATVVKGSTASLTCGVSHDPAIAVQWFWFSNGKLVSAADGRKAIDRTGSLEIQSVRSDDIGIYTCAVISVGGNVSASAYLSVLELPYQPTLLSVALNSQSQKAVDVTWIPGFDGNTLLLYYIIEYRLVNSGVSLLDSDGWIVASNQVPAEARMYTVVNLLPAKSYEFRVTAVNLVGKGTPSVASPVVELPQQAPSGPPLSVAGSPRSNSSIILKWQPPHSDAWNGALLGYIIRYCLAGYPDTTLAFVNVSSYGQQTDYTYELGGLIVFQEYEIGVAAYNIKGIGTFSSYIRVMTQEGVPTSYPRNVSGTAKNSTSIILVWLPPDPQYINGINQGYKIFATNVDTGIPLSIFIIQSDTTNMLGKQSALLGGFDKFTLYSFQVLCFTSKGDGPKSPAVEVQTFEDVPSHVENILFDNLTDISVRVLWTPPMYSNGILISYTVSLKSFNQSRYFVSKIVGAGTRSLIISDLEPITTYFVDIFASSRAGNGPVLSNTFTTKMTPVLPRPPFKLAVTNIGTTSALLQFEPGFDGNTPIVSWIVEAQQSNTSDWFRVFALSNPLAVTVTVPNLIPYVSYRLRLLAENIVGHSEPSEPTRWFQTLQALPKRSPSGVTVRALNETALAVKWTAFNALDWMGSNGHFVISCDSMMDEQRVLEVDGSVNSIIITDLQEWVSYSVQVAACNAVGCSEYNFLPVSQRTWESVPSAAPQNLSAVALNSTAILLKWHQVPIIEQNGLILGYKIYYQETGLLPEMLVINNETSTHAVLVGLKKFTNYSLHILAFTRMGNGLISEPSILVRTLEDVPGLPANVYCPDVSFTTVKIVWSPPRQPNGIILGYSLSYQQINDNDITSLDELGSDRRDHFVSGLIKGKKYLFYLKARTSVGWGNALEFAVVMTIERTVPNAPVSPWVKSSNGVGDKWVIINWLPVNDSYAPLRNYTLQLRVDSGNYITSDEYIAPHVTSYNVTGLKSYSKYIFRLAACNDVGISAFSQPSSAVTTLPTAPSGPPVGLTVSAQSRNAVTVSWQPPPTEKWNGNPQGYEVWYYRLDSHKIEDYCLIVLYPQTRIDVTNLDVEVNYVFKVCALNKVGCGPFSNSVITYTGKAVPSAPPVDVKATALSSNSILLSWQPPPKDSWNGNLLGYKVFWWCTNCINKMKSFTVSPSSTNIKVDSLEVYTKYGIVLLAFNDAGNGPNSSQPIYVQTLEGVPDAPLSLVCIVTSLASVNVSWTLASRSRGVITLHELTYNQLATDGKSDVRSVTLLLPEHKVWHEISDLIENVTYLVSLRSRTNVGWGKSLSYNITVGPCEGSPSTPQAVSAMQIGLTFTLTWVQPPSANAPTSFIIQAKSVEDSKWQSIDSTITSGMSATVNVYSFLPLAQYQFRVIAVNQYGVSAPSLQSQLVQPQEVVAKAYYEQWWFLIIMALAAAIVLIILICKCLICGRKRRKIPKPSETRRMSRPPQLPLPIPPSITMNTIVSTGTLSRNSLNRSRSRPNSTHGTEADENEGFELLETVGQGHKTLRSRMGDSLRRSNIRSPPRPSPGSVNYEDEDTKTLRDDDCSSLTEKASLSSDESNQRSEPANDSVPSAQFATLRSNYDGRQSWHLSRPPPVLLPNSSFAPPAYEYQPTGGQLTYALNGGHVFVNNIAGNRAPLPGFSSFV